MFRYRHLPNADVSSRRIDRNLFQLQNSQKVSPQLSAMKSSIRCTFQDRFYPGKDSAIIATSLICKVSIPEWSAPLRSHNNMKICHSNDVNTNII